MATTKRNYPNDYYAWYNDDGRIAIVEKVTSTDGGTVHHDAYDTFQSSGDLSGTISSFADYNGTVAGTTKATCSASHGLATGDRVTITSSPDGDLDGNYSITVVDADEFYFSKSHVAESSGTFTSLFVDDGFRLTYHSKYTDVDAQTDDLYTDAGLDSGMHQHILCYVKARLLEDMGDLEKAQYYRKMFEIGMKQYPMRKSGVRSLSVPKL